MTIPAYQRAVWEDGKVTNKGDLPLWSGRGEPPAIGSEVRTFDRFRHRVTITGYQVEGGWLMATGYRTDEPAVKGNLAGAEIYWGEPEQTV